MIKVKDKKDSIIKMQELGLNYFPLNFFDTSDLEGIEIFLRNIQPKNMFLEV